MSEQPWHERRDPQTIADMQLNVIDAMADAWAAEVNLSAMIINATSPMRLNRNAPDDVRDRFHKRMIEQIDAIARQCFLEGAIRVLDLAEEEIRRIKNRPRE